VVFVLAPSNGPSGSINESVLHPGGQVPRSPGAPVRPDFGHGTQVSTMHVEYIHVNGDRNLVDTRELLIY
jgi:hypothetical protein